MICFCSHQPIALVDANCLSQWYPSVFIGVGTYLAERQDSIDISYEGIEFHNAEQFMMYSKALIFRDELAAKQILEEEDPRGIKGIGKLVRNFDEAIWHRHARNIVFEGNMCKFNQNEPLKKYLLSTGDRPLVESAHYDKVWGTGLNEKDTRKTPQDKWPGKNWLGQTLVHVRTTLASSLSKPDQLQELA